MESTTFQIKQIKPSILFLQSAFGIFHFWEWNYAIESNMTVVARNSRIKRLWFPQWRPLISSRNVTISKVCFHYFNSLKNGMKKTFTMHLSSNILTFLMLHWVTFTREITVTLVLLLFCFAIDLSPYLDLLIYSSANTLRHHFTSKNRAAMRRWCKKHVLTLFSVAIWRNSSLYDT